MAGNNFEEALSITNFLDLLTDERGCGCRVVIIDSGASQQAPLQDSVNLTDKSLVDTERHGRYIHEIIHRILPEAEIFLVKVPDPVQDNLLITALKEAERFKPDAVNLSITSEYPSDGTDPISTYVNHVAKKTVVVISAGNGGPKLMSIGTPAVAEEALTVGATTTQGRLWKGSSRGPTLDGRWKPNVVAPTNYTLRDSDSSLLVGTSFSTPLATALAAILHREIRDPYAVRKLIEITAKPIPIPASSTLTLQGVRKQSIIRRLMETWPRLTDPRNHTGMGLINAKQAKETTTNIRKAMTTNMK